MGTLAGLVPAGAADAAVTGIPNVGSIVHIKGNDVWLTSPDATISAQVTSNGGTPDPEGMGDKPYISPSQSDAGDIVAVRNQLGADGWTRGYLWVMNRTGTVIKKFAPPQQPFTRSAVGCNDFGEVPGGIVTAAVSPDGSKIVYWDRWLIRSTADCSIDARRAIRVVDINNATPPKHIVEPDGSSQALSHPSWVNSSRLLVSGDPEVGVVDLPDATARPWFATGAEEGDNFPVLEGDRLATTGPSTWFGEKELRLWHAPDATDVSLPPDRPG